MAEKEFAPMVRNATRKFPVLDFTKVGVCLVLFSSLRVLHARLTLAIVRIRLRSLILFESKLCCDLTVYDWQHLFFYILIEMMSNFICCVDYLRILTILSSCTNYPCIVFVLP